MSSIFLGVVFGPLHDCICIAHHGGTLDLSRRTCKALRAPFQVRFPWAASCDEVVDGVPAVVVGVVIALIVAGAAPLDLVLPLNATCSNSESIAWWKSSTFF